MKFWLKESYKKVECKSHAWNITSLLHLNEFKKLDVQKFNQNKIRMNASQDSSFLLFMH